jgi:hypothetical protein
VSPVTYATSLLVSSVPDYHRVSSLSSMRRFSHTIMCISPIYGCSFASGLTLSKRVEKVAREPLPTPMSGGQISEPTSRQGSLRSPD